MVEFDLLDMAVLLCFGPMHISREGREHGCTIPLSGMMILAPWCLPLSSESGLW